jgi:hypothetical protein
MVFSFRVVKFELAYDFFNGEENGHGYLVGAMVLVGDKVYSQVLNGRVHVHV